MPPGDLSRGPNLSRDMLRARVGELPDSAALAREAAAMEERLRQLRVAVQLEQHRRASIP